MDGFLAGLAAAFIFGSLWFWIALLVLTVAIVWFDEEDSPFLAAISVGLFMVLLNTSGVISLGSWGITSFVLGLLLYIGLGVGWSFVKWFSFVMKRRDDLTKYRADFIKQGQKGKIRLDSDDRNYFADEGVSVVKQADPFVGVSVDISEPLPRGLRQPFRAFLARAGYWGRSEHIVDYETASLIPSAGDYKARVVRWIMFWPWSAAWTLLNDPLRRVVNYLFTRLKETYQKVSAKVFGNISNDM